MFVVYFSTQALEVDRCFAKRFSLVLFMPEGTLDYENKLFLIQAIVEKRSKTGEALKVEIEGHILTITS